MKKFKRYGCGALAVAMLLSVSGLWAVERTTARERAAAKARAAKVAREARAAEIARGVSLAEQRKAATEAQQRWIEDAALHERDVAAALEYRAPEVQAARTAEAPRRGTAERAFFAMDVVPGMYGEEDPRLVREEAEFVAWQESPLSAEEARAAEEFAEAENAADMARAAAAHAQAQQEEADEAEWRAALERMVAEEPGARNVVETEWAAEIERFEAEQAQLIAQAAEEAAREEAREAYEVQGAFGQPGMAVFERLDIPFVEPAPAPAAGAGFVPPAPPPPAADWRPEAQRRAAEPRQARPAQQQRQQRAGQMDAEQLRRELQAAAERRAAREAARGAAPQEDPREAARRGAAERAEADRPAWMPPPPPHGAGFDEPSEDPDFDAF